MNNNVLTKKELAKLAVETYVTTGNVPDVLESQIPESLKKRLACFVTVYVNKNLRGCIGTIEPVGSLYRSIIHNAVAAASEDFRFPSITKGELPDLSVEVSVLSPMRPYQFKNKEDLVGYLQKNKPGLVLEKHGAKALFLPQVWEELPDPVEFLANLSVKAGLNPHDWENNTRFWVFTADV